MGWSAFKSGGSGEAAPTFKWAVTATSLRCASPFAAGPACSVPVLPAATAVVELPPGGCDLAGADDPEQAARMPAPPHGSNATHLVLSPGPLGPPPPPPPEPDVNATAVALANSTPATYAYAPIVASFAVPTGAVRWRINVRRERRRDRPRTAIAADHPLVVPCPLAMAPVAVPVPGHVERLARARRRRGGHAHARHAEARAQRRAGRCCGGGRPRALPAAAGRPVEQLLRPVVSPERVRCVRPRSRPAR